METSIIARTRPDSLAAEDPQVVAGLDGAGRQRERLRGVLVGHGGQDVEEQIAADQTEHLGHGVGRHLAARKRHHLVERALGVPHAAFGVARQQRDGVVGRLDLLGVGNRAKLPGDRGGPDGAELVLLRPGADGVGNLLQLGRRQDEDDVRRRLFDRLQQRVEGWFESWCTSSMMKIL